MLKRATVFIVLAACGDDDAENKAPKVMPAELQSALEAAAEDHWASALTLGVEITVVHDGAEWRVGKGWKDVLETVPMEADARFRVGSITKTFSSAVLLQLADEGKLDLDDPVDDWVDGFDLGPEVTIRRCMNHTSGIFSYTDDYQFITRVVDPITPREIVTFALEHERVFPPGTDWEYSNTNYVLLGLVIEAADGRPHQESLHARLIDPLGLTNTFVESGEPAPGLVQGFINELDLGVPFDPSWGYGTGSIVSNGSDLCRWAEALYRGHDVLPADAVALMTTETVAGPDPTEYGLGTYLYMRDGVAVTGHTGSTMGFNAELFIDRTNGDCVAVLTNDFLGKANVVAEPIWQALHSR